MLTTAKLTILVTLATGMSYAETWTGKLVDSTCFPSKEVPTKCDATKATTSFAVLTADGKQVKFDAEGNLKTGTAMGGFPDAKGPNVMVTGIVKDEVLKVESIEIRQ
jgi:hypothetical protein